MRGIGRSSRKSRTGENVSIRPIPNRVVEHVECFHPELYDMGFGMWHMEYLVHREIDRLKVRCNERVSSEIAESSKGGFDERGRVVPSGRAAVRSVSTANQRGDWAIVAGIARTGVVDAADVDVLRNAALNRQIFAGPAATDQDVGHRIVNVQELAFA